MSEYVVHAIKYARIGDRTAAENFMNGDPHNGPMPMDFFVWTLTDGDRTIVVDTGFDQATAARRGRMVSRPVEEGLRAVDVDPLITHRLPLDDAAAAYAQLDRDPAHTLQILLTHTAVA